jgi:hypothetical protein
MCDGDPGIAAYPDCGAVGERSEAFPTHSINKTINRLQNRQKPCSGHNICQLDSMMQFYRGVAMVLCTDSISLVCCRLWKSYRKPPKACRWLFSWDHDDSKNGHGFSAAWILRGCRIQRRFLVFHHNSGVLFSDPFVYRPKLMRPAIPWSSRSAYIRLLRRRRLRVFVTVVMAGY